MTEAIPARWFDGRSSREQAVWVTLHPGPRGPSLHIHPAGQGAGEGLQLEGTQVGWPEKWSTGRAAATVVVDLRGHGSLAVDDVPRWQAACASAGKGESLAQRMQTRWTVFLLVAIVAAGAVAAFYRWGTPWAAAQLSRAVPLNWEQAFAARALQSLDHSWLKPSLLPPERQAQLRARFDVLVQQVGASPSRYPGYAPVLSLSFRSGLGPNAFALPGGTVVMTDALVETAAKLGLDDAALAGVMAHEIGHVMHRHTTRLIVEQGVLNVGLGLALGDVSSLLSMGSSLLTGLAYRRNHETEADCFAVALMQRSQVAAAPTADLLLGIEGIHTDRNSTGGNTLASFLSSHPETKLRAQKLKQGEVGGC